MQKIPLLSNEVDDGDFKLCCTTVLVGTSGFTSDSLSVSRYSTSKSPDAAERAVLNGERAELISSICNVQATNIFKKNGSRKISLFLFI